MSRQDRQEGVPIHGLKRYGIIESNCHEIVVDTSAGSPEHVLPLVHAEPAEPLEQRLRLADADLRDPRARPYGHRAPEATSLANVPENTTGKLRQPLTGGAIVHGFGVQGKFSFRPVKPLLGKVRVEEIQGRNPAGSGQ